MLLLSLLLAPEEDDEELLLLLVDSKKSAACLGITTTTFQNRSCNGMVVVVGVLGQNPKYCCGFTDVQKWNLHYRKSTKTFSSPGNIHLFFIFLFPLSKFLL
jgi:hypothetical protein